MTIKSSVMLDRVRMKRAQLSAALLGSLSLVAGNSHAYTFETSGGWSGSIDTTLSVGSSWRAQGRDKDLYSPADGQAIGKTNGTAGAAIDSGNLNYDRGERFSTIYKALSELSISKGDMGGVLRVKAWYDQALENEGVHYGNQANGFARGKPLSDDGFDDLQRSKGIYLLDSYVYDTFYPSDRPLQVRFGRQVVNWGESVFIQGVNQINPLDVPSLRRPGTEIKEALLPLWMLYGSYAMTDSVSVEAFYQLKSEPTVVEGCGNYWSVTENIISTHPGSCTMASPLGNASQNYADNFYTPLVSGNDARDSGQWGVALRFQLESLDTEMGLYAMNIHSRLPFFSTNNGVGVGALGGYPTLAEQLADTSGATKAATGFYEYPEDIRIYGVSAATTLAGWSVGAELSYSPNTPVQRNGVDIIYGLNLGVGPEATAIAEAGDLAYVRGYDRFEKTQFQVNGVNVFPNVLGASQLLVIGEVGFQWNNVPDANDDNIRYGRAIVFGAGSHSTYGGNLCSGGNTSPDGCKNAGYVTDFSWGYRLRAELEYADPLGIGVTVKPSVFFSHDVEGNSMDGQFNEDRMTIGLGTRFDYLKAHSVELNYVTFNDSAKYDPLRDRDYFSASYSYKF
ncbi:DUF1302 domain-containing protein [Pseudomonas farris]